MTLTETGKVVIFQSTRPVRGATLLALCERPRYVFQSTRPVRGATLAAYIEQKIVEISIHAPRAGRDPEKRRECPQ